MSEVAPVGAHRRLAGRDARGRFASGNDGHLSTGVRSGKAWSALAPLLRAERITILDAKGHTEQDADPVLLRIVDAFNQSVVMMNSYFEFLSSTGGPISAKGRTRRAVEGWSRAADRVAKFAQMLGLERRARRVKQTTRDWLLEHDQHGHDDQTDQTGQTEADPATMTEGPHDGRPSAHDQ